MNMDRLTKMRIGVLTEANTPEDLVGDFIDEQKAQGNLTEESDNDANQDQNNNTPDDQTSEPADNAQDNPDESDNDYDIGNNQDNQPQEGDEQQQDQNADDIPDVPDDYKGTDEAPKLKILNSLTDKEYKLNNLKCYEDFIELYRNVKNSLNNNIMNILTKNKRQKQLVSLVHNNLSNMLEDLDNYMQFKFGDVYEDNILAYVTFLKRYHIAMKVISIILDEINNG